MIERSEKFFIKDTDYWKSEIDKAGLINKLRFFNDVVTENRPPHKEANYGEPVLLDVILDGQKCDIYHTDKSSKDTWHRIFIHLKD